MPELQFKPGGYPGRDKLRIPCVRAANVSASLQFSEDPKSKRAAGHRTFSSLAPIFPATVYRAVVPVVNLWSIADPVNNTQESTI